MTKPTSGTFTFLLKNLWFSHYLAQWVSSRYSTKTSALALVAWTTCYDIGDFSVLRIWCIYVVLYVLYIYIYTWNSGDQQTTILLSTSPGSITHVVKGDILLQQTWKGLPQWVSLVVVRVKNGRSMDSQSLLSEIIHLGFENFGP